MSDADRDIFDKIHSDVAGIRERQDRLERRMHDGFQELINRIDRLDRLERPNMFRRLFGL